MQDAAEDVINGGLVEYGFHPGIRWTASKLLIAHGAAGCGMTFARGQEKNFIV